MHVAQYEWKDLCRKIDLTMSNPELVRVICTDFAATLDLLAAAKENSSVNNHAVCAIFLVNYNWRKVKFKTDEGTWDEAIVSDCDKWVFFGASMSKGKKNDHVYHNACLDHIISYYDKERQKITYLQLKQILYGRTAVPLNINVDRISLELQPAESVMVRM